MAILSSLTRMGQAPTAPVVIPNDALVLVEIGTQVFKTTYDQISGGGGPAPSVDWTALPGYDAGEVQVLTNTSGTIGWVKAE